MKNYIELVGKEIYFIKKVTESYNSLLIRNKKITLEKIFDNFYFNLIKEDEVYKDFKITSEVSSKGNTVGYLIYSPNSINTEKRINNFFELTRLVFNINKKNEIDISHISLSKFLKEDSLFIVFSIEKENINITIKQEDGAVFAMSTINVDINNKVNVTNFMLEIPENKKFKSAYYLINKLQNVENPEKIMDYLIIDKEIKEEDLNLYLLAFDFDFRDAANNPLKLNLEVKNKLLVNNRTVKIK